MGLFGFIPKEDVETKRADLVLVEKYNRKMEHYSKSLENLDGIVEKLENMVSGYETKDHDQQVNNVNFVLDLKYLKEQGDQVSERLMDVSDIQLKEIKKQVDIGHALIEEMNHNLEKDQEIHEDTVHGVLSNRRLLRVVIVLQSFMLAGIIAILLSLLGVIVF